MALQIEICPEADAVAQRGAEHVARQAGAAIADDGRFTFAVSGGHTPWAMFAHLVAGPIAWEDVTIFQVDERVAPAGDPDRNLTHPREALGRAAAADVRPMPVEATRPRARGGPVRRLAARVVRSRPSRLGTGRSHGFARAWRSGARDQ